MLLRVLCGSRPRPPPPPLWFSLPSSPPTRLFRTPPIAAHLNGHSTSLTTWHAILPSLWRRRRRHLATMMRSGAEGSWNVAWDARPARWLHHPDSAWLLFGVCASIAAPLIDPAADSNLVESAAAAADDSGTDSSCDYRVTGVAADGRCLFRAIAHVACLRNGEEAPDGNRQTELADELRAQVVEELLRRRKEVEWCIEEEFDVYVKRIKEPYSWGGEPELIMASHVLGMPISVFMKAEGSGNLVKIADYGDEYRREGENSINLLFYGYGHYDILEADLNRKLLPL